MKTLSNYTEQALTEIFDETGAFFAFGDDQFAEKKKEGVTYRGMGGGLICPLENCLTLFEGIEEIHAAGIAKDIKENGIRAIIERELYNHECFYISDYSDAVDALKDYKITKEQVKKVYAEVYPTVDCW